jgi:hypothetical protein
VKLKMEAVEYIGDPFAKPWSSYRWQAYITLIPGRTHGRGMWVAGKWARTKRGALKNLKKQLGQA